jgi:hypothetical protein
VITPLICARSLAATIWGSDSFLLEEELASEGGRAEAEDEFERCLRALHR